MTSNFYTHGTGCVDEISSAAIEPTQLPKLPYEFEEPPPPTPPRPDWREAIKAAKRHPGRWLKFPARKGTDPKPIQARDDTVEVRKAEIDGEFFIYLRAERPIR